MPWSVRFRWVSMFLLTPWSSTSKWQIGVFALSIYFAKDCLLTGQEHACSRITRLVVCRRHHTKNGQLHRKMVVECWLKVKLFSSLKTRSDKEWGIIGQASLLHSLRWVLFISNFQHKGRFPEEKNAFFRALPEWVGAGPWSLFSFVHDVYQVAGPTTLLHGGRHHDHGGALEGGGESPKVGSSMMLTMTKQRQMLEAENLQK